MSLKIVTYNIHKGFNWNNTKVTIEALKNNLESIQPDIVFLQEVVGENKLHASKFENWIANQFEFLANSLWDQSAFSHHAVFDHSHHGNVILSKYPIIHEEVFDISVNSYEKRAILYVQLQVHNKKIDCFCVHLNLLGRDRLKQYQLIKDKLSLYTDQENPIILAGDFNDWNKKASKNLFDIYSIHDAYKSYHGHYAKTFPVLFPLLSLDRIYLKGFKTISALVPRELEWSKLSDHLPILIEVDFDE